MNDVIAVYPNRAQAHRAARAALDAGVPARNIRIGNHEDEGIALKESVKHEMDSALVAPPTIVAPPEMSEGIASAVIPGILLGAVTGFVFGLLSTWILDQNWSRLTITTAVGAFAGLITAFMIGGRAGAEKAMHQPLAAEDGTTISIHAPTEDVISILENTNPTQIDRVKTQHD